MKKKIIITGMTGSVSNYFYEKFKKKYDVTRLSRIQRTKDNILSYNTSKISNQDIYILLHISSYSPKSNDKIEQIKSYHLNTNLDKNILKLISRNKIKKIIFFSSTSVFKNIEKKTLISKSKTYGYSKLNMENKLEKLNSNTYVIRIPSLLYRNGAGNWINKICRNLRYNKNIEVSDPNNLYNNCIDIYTLSKIVDAIIKKNVKKQEHLVLHPCSKDPIKIKDILKMLLKKYDKYDGKIKIIKLNLQQQINYHNDTKILKLKQIKVSTTIKRFLNDEFTYKKILVLGSKGYIGSNLMNFNFNKKQTIGASSKNYNFNLKYYDSKLLHKINNAEIIIFLLQNNSKKNFVKKNTNLLLNVFRNINCINSKKLLYISTTTQINDDYLSMHLKREKIINEHSNQNFLILKIPSIYGAQNIQKINFGINGFINKAKKNQNINLRNSGLNIRHHLFMYDFLKILNKILKYNLCGSYVLPFGEKISFLKISKKIERFSNIKILNKIGKNPYPGDEKLSNLYIEKNFSYKISKMDKYIKNQLK